MISQRELKAEEVRVLALDVMERHLKLEVSGYKCNSAMLCNVLLKAAADGLSIDAVSQYLSGLVAANTMRVASEPSAEREGVESARASDE